jgi:hypothetical protein
VQQGGPGAAAGQQEAAQRRQLLVVGVALLLQPGDVGLVDPQRRVGRRRLRHRVGQVGADVEQLVLHPGQHVDDVRRELAERDGRADGAVGLLHVGVGGQPGIRLGGAAAVGERGAAVVTGARVDAGQHDRVLAAVT